MDRGWSFIVPAVVMVAVTIIIFLFLVTGKCCLCDKMYLYTYVQCVCVCVCVCSYRVHICPNTYVRMYVYTSTWIYTYIRTYMYILYLFILKPGSYIHNRAQINADYCSRIIDLGPLDTRCHDNM